MRLASIAIWVALIAAGCVSGPTSTPTPAATPRVTPANVEPTEPPAAAVLRATLPAELADTASYVGTEGVAGSAIGRAVVRAGGEPSRLVALVANLTPGSYYTVLTVPGVSGDALASALVVDWPNVGEELPVEAFEDRSVRVVLIHGGDNERLYLLVVGAVVYAVNAVERPVAEKFYAGLRL